MGRITKTKYTIVKRKVGGSTGKTKYSNKKNGKRNMPNTRKRSK